MLDTYEIVGEYEYEYIKVYQKCANMNMNIVKPDIWDYKYKYKYYQKKYIYVVGCKDCKIMKINAHIWYYIQVMVFG